MRSEIIYKLYDLADGKDLLIQTTDKGVIGEAINALRFEGALDGYELEIHEVNKATGKVNINKNWYSYTI